MSQNLYLYTQPFFKSTSISHPWIYDYLEDNERKDVEKIHAHLLKFLISEKLVDVVEERLFYSSTKDISSFDWHLTWMNFRSLIDPQSYFYLINSLQNKDKYYMNQLLDLHVRLGSLFSDKLLNTLVNRVMNSVQLIPYEYVSQDTTQKLSWETIHKQTPFVWLIILLQVILRSEANPPV